PHRLQGALHREPPAERRTPDGVGEAGSHAHALEALLVTRTDLGLEHALAERLPVTGGAPQGGRAAVEIGVLVPRHVGATPLEPRPQDRKSTRLNSSHVAISYAVF